MAREDYPGTFYAHEYTSDERELGAGPPSAAPVYETLTGESYELKSNLGVYTIDTSKISSFDEATQTPAKLFEQMPTPETEMERRQRLFPGTYYAYVYSDTNDFAYEGPPSLGTRVERLTGEGYYLTNDFLIDVSQIPEFDESAETPAILFEQRLKGEQPTTLEFNNVYYMTPQEIELLATSQRLSGEEIKYASDFLINVLKVPFKLSGDNYTEEKVRIEYDGSALDNIESYALLTDTVTADFGSINVPEKYGNSRDYEDSAYIMRLPFISDSEKLSAADVVGKAVSVSVSFGVYTGDATATVYTDNIETPIAVMTGRIGRKIPFSSREESRDLSASGFKDSFSTFMTPFIEVRTPEILESEFLNLVEKSGTLAGVSGYVEVSDSSMTVMGATESERREIKSLLEDGVYIK